MKYSRNLRWLLAGGTLLFWAIVLWWMNSQTLFVSDDFRYHFIYESFMPPSNPKRIDSFTDIIKSMKNHYYMWGGRIPAHFLVQWALWWGKPLFNIMNTIVYLALICLIYFQCRPMNSQNYHLWMLALIPFALWWWIPQFGMTVLWISGACNYLVGSTMIVAFLGYYQRMFERDALKKRVKKHTTLEVVLLFVLGIIVGWTNENTAGAMLVMGGMFGILIFIKHRRIPLSYFSGGIGAVIGFNLLLFAPGNAARSVQETSPLSEFIDIVQEFITVPATLIIILGILTLLSWKRIKKSWELLGIVIVYGIGSMLAVGVMLLSPERPPRTFFGAIIFLIIIIMMLISRLIESYPKVIFIPWVLTLLLMLPWYQHARPIFTDLNETSNHWMEQYQIIEEAKINKQEIVEIKELPFYPRTQYNPYWRTANFTNNPDSWFNSWAATYFEVPSIILK